MEKTKLKTNRHESESGRRRSSGSYSLSDSETIPNYLRASRGSCHDHCKPGFVREDVQLIIKSSRAAAGRRVLRKNKLAINSEEALAAGGGRSLRKNSKIGGGASISREQPARRSCSDIELSDPRRLQLIERKHFEDLDRTRSGGLGMGNDTQHTRLFKKHVRAFPERSSTAKGSSSKIPKKPDNTIKKNRKHRAEHPPEGISHGVETEDESQVDEITLGSINSLGSIWDSSSDESTGRKEATTSELVHSEETSRCIELIDNNTDKQETDLTAEAKNKVTSNEYEDSDSSPRKLRFRKGKEIDVELSDNSTKKLNFRKHGILTENKDCNTNVTVSLRKTETGNPQSCPINHMPVVELRSQVDEENDTDTPGSYNTMIKETANKLSRTNTKVKALVGAFESVISFLDTNSQSSKRKNAPTL